MSQLEELMFLVSGVFLYPVLIILVFLFCYCFVALGSFAWQALQRKRNRKDFIELTKTSTLAALVKTPAPSSGLGQNQANQHNSQVADIKLLRGFPLAQLFISNPNVSKDALDVAALKDLETVRTVSRLAPMLGLIATMIPMGPALKSLANGNVQGISENLIVAFSAVIFGLIIASISFWIATIKKRWLATELVALTSNAYQNTQESAEEFRREAA